jgi:fructosamine-3-kinase
VSVASPLPNPESEWSQDDILGVTRDEIVERIGSLDAPIQIFSGGHANSNVRIGGDRVLRIYRRDETSIEKEKRLLETEWASFRSPKVLEQGSDFLLMEFVPHEPLLGSREHGAAIGRALVEIHATAFEQCGFLAEDAGHVEQPFDGFVDAALGHLHAMDGLAPEIRDPVSSELESCRQELESLAASPVLLHGDFKVSNLHWAADGRPLVLDWEFAWSGPALADVGQLFRWEPPADFRLGFMSAYRAAGGELPDDWLTWASRLDLINMIGLLERAEPGTRRYKDIFGRIRKAVS